MKTCLAMARRIGFVGGLVIIVAAIMKWSGAALGEPALNLGAGFMLTSGFFTLWPTGRARTRRVWASANATTPKASATATGRARKRSQAFTDPQSNNNETPEEAHP